MIKLEVLKEFLKSLDRETFDMWADDIVSLAQQYYEGQGEPLAGLDKEEILAKLERDMYGHAPFANVEELGPMKWAIELSAGRAGGNFTGYVAKLTLEFEEGLVGAQEQGKPDRSIFDSIENLREWLVGNIGFHTLPQAASGSTVTAAMKRNAMMTFLPDFRKAMWEAFESLEAMVDDYKKGYASADIKKAPVPAVDMFSTDLGGRISVRDERTDEGETKVFTWGYSDKEPGKFSWVSSVGDGVGSLASLKSNLDKFLKSAK